MAYNQVQRAVSLWITTDYLPYDTVDTLAFRVHVMCVGPASPGYRLKECGESGMHTHLLSAAFQLTSVSPYFFGGNVAGATVQITRLYNSGVERLKNEEDWPMRAASIHLRPMEVSDRQGVFYLHGALGAGQSRRGLELKRRVVTTCEVPAEIISAAGE